MQKLPVNVGVGLVVLTSPLPHVSSRFKALFPQISSHVEKLLYVHILPESNTWPPKLANDLNDFAGLSRKIFGSILPNTGRTPSPYVRSPPSGPPVKDTLFSH